MCAGEQKNIREVFDLEGMVVKAMVKDKNLIVELFQECGRKELRFVVNSGLYFGFLLGVFQMAVWVVWDPWWSLAVGGAYPRTPLYLFGRLHSVRRNLV